MQIIGKPRQKLLPLSVRKRVRTEEVHDEKPGGLGELRASRLRLKTMRGSGKGKRLGKGSYLRHCDFVVYELGDIDRQTRRAIKNLLSSNLTIKRTKKLTPTLLPTVLLQALSENLKPLPYSCPTYLSLTPILLELFQQFLPIPEKTIMLAQGQISQFFYFFFDDCFEIPYSLCCEEIVYVRVEVGNGGREGSGKKGNRNGSQILKHIKEVKTEIICQKCKNQVGYFFGKSSDESSAEKTKRDILIEEQRRKLSIGVMIGSGKHKIYRIDSPHKYESVSTRFNPESIFSYRKQLQQRKQSTEPSIHPQTSILSQRRYPTLPQNAFP